MVIYVCAFRDFFGDVRRSPGLGGIGTTLLASSRPNMGSLPGHVLLSLRTSYVGNAAEEPYEGKPHVRLCVQRRLACSAGDSPVGVKARSPVARIAGWRETEILKPIDKVI